MATLSPLVKTTTFRKELWLIPEEEIKSTWLLTPPVFSRGCGVFDSDSYGRDRVCERASTPNQRASSREHYELEPVVKRLKTQPLKLIYRGIDGPLQLLVITNSGYKGEDQDHLAARGALIALSRGFKVGDSRRVGWPEGLSRQSSTAPWACSALRSTWR